MAKERIFIKYYEDTDCLHGYGVERTVELTRQEAIERMAKAMFDWKGHGSRGDVPKEDVWENEKFCLENLAQAALNALLEEK